MTFLLLIAMSNPAKTGKKREKYITTKKADWEKIKQESCKFSETFLKEYMQPM